MTVRQDLEAAKALIDTPRKWCKGHYHTGGFHGYDQHCMIGAVLASDVNFASRDATREALVKALPAAERKLPHALATFNDNHTHADIMALFDRAINSAALDELRKPVDEVRE